MGGKCRNWTICFGARLFQVHQNRLDQWFLTFFYISYPPFIKQDNQIYPQYIQWCSFLKNIKLTNRYSLE